MAGASIEVRPRGSERESSQATGYDELLNPNTTDPSTSPLNFSFSFDERTQGIGRPKLAMDTALTEASESLNRSLGSLKSELINQLKSDAGSAQEGEKLARSGMAQAANPHELGARQAVSLGVSDNLVPEVAHRTWVRATAIAAGASAEVAGEAKKQEQIKNQQEGGERGAFAPSPSRKEEARDGAVPNPRLDSGSSKIQVEPERESRGGLTPDIKARPVEAEEEQLKKADQEQGERAKGLAGDALKPVVTELGSIESEFGHETMSRVTQDSVRVLRTNGAFKDFDPSVLLTTPPEVVANAMESEAGRILRIEGLRAELVQRRRAAAPIAA